MADTRRTPLRLVAVCVGFAVGFASCGDDDDEPVADSCAGFQTFADDYTEGGLTLAEIEDRAVELVRLSEGADAELAAAAQMIADGAAGQDSDLLLEGIGRMADACAR